MANISRHEAGLLLEKFKQKHVDNNPQLGDHPAYHIGVSTMEKELRTGTGPASPKLRSYARVLKHFLEADRGPDTVFYVNHIIHKIDLGHDAGRALKRARSELDLAAKKKELRALDNKARQEAREARKSAELPRTEYEPGWQQTVAQACA